MQKLLILSARQPKNKPPESVSENSISHDISQHCNALEDFDLLSGQTRGKHKDGRRENILDLLVFAER